jgi:hypothetical protein
MSDNQKVRELAYSLWQQAGEPEGDGVNFWIQAESELYLQEAAAVAEVTLSKSYELKQEKLTV